MIERDQMDRRLAAGLEEVLAAQIRHDADRWTRATRRRSAQLGGRTVWVTAVVGVAVVLLTVAVIHTVSGRHHTALPATTSTGSSPEVTSSAEATPATLLQKLPTQRYGTVVHTWTEHTAASSGPFAVTGSTVVIGGICEGGGAVAISDAAGKTHTLSCTKQSIQQPFWRFQPGRPTDPTVATGPVHVSVTVVKGAPRFIVRMWKVDPRVLRSTWVITNTSSTVPASLRSCAAGDLAATGTFKRLPSQQGGVVTITNRSSTDCAIRSWPAMRYLNKAGMPIGPTQGGTSDNGRALDSLEGAVNKFNEFPPARLTAGGHGYLIADLFTFARLATDDAATRAEAAKAAASPSPSGAPQVFSAQYCNPVKVAAIRLTISGSTVTVPVPASPVTAACPSDGFSFGVNPVIARDPGVR